MLSIFKKHRTTKITIHTYITQHNLTWYCSSSHYITYILHITDTYMPHDMPIHTYQYIHTQTRTQAQSQTHTDPDTYVYIYIWLCIHVIIYIYPTNIMLYIIIDPSPLLFLRPLMPSVQELQVLLHRWQFHGLNEFLRGERAISVVVHQAEELLPKQRGENKGEWLWGC